jgi:hypothetical protein
MLHSCIPNARSAFILHPVIGMRPSEKTPVALIIETGLRVAALASPSTK